MGAWMRLKHSTIFSIFFFFSSRRRHTRSKRDWSSDVCSSDLVPRLLFSGGPCCGRSASALMGTLAHDLGVPRSAIFLEERSTRTSENARYSRSEERRVGKECRDRWAPEQWKEEEGERRERVWG